MMSRALCSSGADTGSTGPRLDSSEGPYIHRIHMETPIRKWGNSLALRIPKSVAAEAGLDDGSTVDVRVERGAVVARPVETTKKVSLHYLLKKVTKKNVHAEVDTGPRRGREVW